MLSLNNAPKTLRIAWLGMEQADCGDSVHYYCQQYHSLKKAADVFAVPRRVQDATPAAAAFRASADVLLIPPVCCLLPTGLVDCLQHVTTSDPPVVVMLNKVFEGLAFKLSAIKNHSQRHHYLLVTIPAPDVQRYTEQAGVRVRFLPYAASSAFNQFAARGQEFKFDLGFTGSSGRFHERYPLRAQTMGDRSLIRRLRASGVRPPSTFPCVEVEP